jgi:hypothetical protein
MHPAILDAGVASRHRIPRDIAPSHHHHNAVRAFVADQAGWSLPESA